MGEKGGAEEVSLAMNESYWWSNFDAVFDASSLLTTPCSRDMRRRGELGTGTLPLKPDFPKPRSWPSFPLSLGPGSPRDWFGTSRQLAVPFFSVLRPRPLLMNDGLCTKVVMSES